MSAPGRRPLLVLALSLAAFWASGAVLEQQDEGNPSDRTDRTLRTAIRFFKTRGAQEIVSFQCTTLDEAVLLRLASDSGMPAQLQRVDGSLRRADESLYSRVGVFVNASCPGAERVVQDASRHLRFNGSYAWFVAGGPAEGLLALAEGLNLAADSVLALAPADGDAVLVHKAFYHLPLRVAPLSTRAPTQRRDLTDLTDLTGVTVRAVGEAIRGTEYGWDQFPRYLEGFIRDEDPGAIFKQGPRLFDLLRQLYNFTLVMRTVPGGGALLPNGSCSGIPGYLERGDFDFGLQLWLDEGRMQCVQYIAYNLVTFESALVYRMPTRSSSAVNSMVTPFSSGSWAGVFIMFGMMASLLLIADEFHLEEAYGNLGPWSAALIFGTAGISWGSVHYGINSTALISVELGTVIGGLSYTVVFTYYQSSVVFGLLAKDKRQPLSPQEVIKQKYRIVSDDSAYFTDLFETTEDPDLRDIHQRYLMSEKGTESHGGHGGHGGSGQQAGGSKAGSGDTTKGSGSGYVSLAAGARMVKNEHVALVGDRVAVAKQLSPIMTRQQLCTVRASPIHADRSLLFSAARKEWPLADLVKRGLLLGLERGLSRRIVRPFRMPCASGDSSTQTTISALTVTAATTAYAVLTIGYLVCASFCALETVGPRLERALDRLVATRRLSAIGVLFVRRRTRRWSRISGIGVPGQTPSQDRSRRQSVVTVESLATSSSWSGERFPFVH